MAGSLEPFKLGWHPIEPDPGPQSPLLDAPPAPTGVDVVADYLRWRQAVEADEDRLARSTTQPLWHPVPLPDPVYVVPTFGGTPEAIEQVVTTMVLSGVESGQAMTRVVNLSGWSLDGTLREAMSGARHNQARFETISAHGSSINLFGNPKSTKLIALLVDVLRVSAERSGARQAQQEKQELERVVRHLGADASLERIIEAVGVALGDQPAPSSSLALDEVRDLRDYFRNVVDNRPATKDRLGELHLALEGLSGYGRTSLRPGVEGAGKLRVRWFDIGSGSSTDDAEIAREVLARAVMQTFTSGSAGNDVLVVVGAERLADEVLDELRSAAQRLRKRLVLMYSGLDGPGRKMLGHAGSSVALFLKMANAEDAEIAAKHFGHQHVFVVNGISIAAGQTQDWSSSFGTSSSRGRSASTTSTRTSGFGGGTINFGRSVGSTVSSSFEQGTSQTRSSGGSRSTTTTTSVGRSYDWVIEPAEFQSMPDDAVLIVGNKTVTVASCANGLRRHKLTSRTHEVNP